MEDTATPFDPKTVTRPDASLLTYYLLVSACTLVAFPFVFLPLYFKFHSLRYEFDDKGVSMSYGVLFKRETYLTYRRIQDIHVTRNLFHRWLGLAAVGVQTASGSAGSEMTIEGIRNPEALRDYLYSRMRGARDDDSTGDADSGEPTSADDALSLLQDILGEVKQVRKRIEALEQQP